MNQQSPTEVFQKEAPESISQNNKGKYRLPKPLLREKINHKETKEVRRNYRLGVLRRFLKRWTIWVPDLPFKLISEQSIKTMQISKQNIE